MVGEEKGVEDKDRLWSWPAGVAQVGVLQWPGRGLWQEGTQGSQRCGCSLLCTFTVAASEGFRGRRLWGAGSISSCTFSDTLARSLVASSSEQCSVLVPLMDRMWSPACRAPLLARWGREGGGWSSRTEHWAASAPTHHPCTVAVPSVGLTCPPHWLA